MTLTTRGCPMHESLVRGVRRALLQIDPVEEVDVRLVWDPPWHPSMMRAGAGARLQPVQDNSLPGARSACPGR